MTVAIIDYGIGNLGSIRNMLTKIGVKSVVTNQSDEISSAKKLILPGVGAFDAGMKRLHSSGLVPLLDDLVLNERRPILGICLGMHLMTKSSEEGSVPGLGWVAAQTRKITLSSGTRLKIPHMGWNEVQPCKESRLVDAAAQQQRFYFVHTYCVHCEHESDVLFKTHYDAPLVAAFEVSNMVGVQFHPEKSHHFGMSLLRNFVEKFEC